MTSTDRTSHGLGQTLTPNEIANTMMLAVDATASTERPSCNSVSDASSFDESTRLAAAFPVPVRGADAGAHASGRKSLRNSSPCVGMLMSFTTAI